ncbi:MAG: hypothetical protein AVO35_08980 [Candidatus Aegiribacteria sp. MLS_C]|nr:MAG: hypothetical protein AVO35_08980 [Candidatus Aegiribacteria sp. MLS_C]
MKKDPRELRKFGVVMAAGLSAVSILLLIRGTGAWRFTAAAGGLFLLLGLTLPRVLAPLERAWMKFAHALGFMMTSILLTVVFFTGVTITGLLMRLLGKRPLNLNISREADSYWAAVDPEGPCDRPEKPY